MKTRSSHSPGRHAGGRRLMTAMAAFAMAAPLLALPVSGMAGDDDRGSHHRSDHEEARRALLSGEVLSLRQVLDVVARDYPGEPIEIEFEHDDGMYLYELKLLQASGRIIKMKVDAATGKIISVKARDRKEEDDD